MPLAYYGAKNAKMVCYLPARVSGSSAGLLIEKAY